MPYERPSRSPAVSRNGSRTSSPLPSSTSWPATSVGMLLSASRRRPWHVLQTRRSASIEQVAPKLSGTPKEETTMARAKKLEGPVTLFAAIETEQHEKLREIAFEQRRSIADVVREAIDQYVAKRPARTSRRRLASGRR